MVKSRQVVRVALRSLAGVAALAAFAVPAQAQSGDGFLFRAPRGSFTFRTGYELANTSGEPFTILERETTIGPRSFDAFNLGVDFGYFMTKRLDLTLTLDVSTRTKSAEYREWEENGQPIVNQSTFDRAGFAAGLRYNFVDRGRQISALAFIPARTIPYVGLSGGAISYEFVQKGDFVEPTTDSTARIFADELHTDGASFMGQAYAGVERRLSARWSLLGEARYTHATAKLVNDYSGLGNIQLSGLALNVGATVRF
jgi:hypothetical protein